MKSWPSWTRTWRLSTSLKKTKDLLPGMPYAELPWKATCLKPTSTTFSKGLTQLIFMGLKVGPGLEDTFAEVESGSPTILLTGGQTASGNTHKLLGKVFIPPPPPINLKE